jgi:DNA-binding CsgD family transcriptional regulator
MNAKPIITEQDTRAMIKLLGAIAGVNGSLSYKRGLLMDGLCELIGVDCWHWSMLGEVKGGDLPSFSVYLKGGFTEQQFADYLKAQEHKDMAMLQAPFFEEFTAKKGHITRLRQQIDVEGRFPKTDVYELWRKADVAPLILSMRPTSSGQISIVSLFRRFDKKLFTPRESKMTHIILTEVPWLHDQAWPNHPGKKTRNISPRQKTVMNLLLQGWSRKEIAYRLEISINTVSGYVKEVYRHFEVHSQSGLIRRFIEGDGGDQ